MFGKNVYWLAERRKTSRIDSCFEYVVQKQASNINYVWFIRCCRDWKHSSLCEQGKSLKFPNDDDTLNHNNEKNVFTVFNVFWKNYTIYNVRFCIYYTILQAFCYGILARIDLNITSSMKNEKYPSKPFLWITTRILISKRYSKPSHSKNHILPN